MVNINSPEVAARRGADSRGYPSSDLGLINSLYEKKGPPPGEYIGHTV